MAKVDKAKILEAMKSIEKQYGQGSIFTLDSQKAVMNIKRWSTGIDDLDEILGGGMPEGRIIEVFGPESSGKTSIAYHLLAQHELALDIPIEGTFDAERAKAFGNKKGQLVVRRAECGEEVIEIGMKFSAAGCPICVVDSVPSMITRKEFEEDDYEKEGQRGRIAALLSRQLPKLVHACEKSGTSFIFINQVRDKMDAMLFGEKTTTPGGRALRHYCSIRLQVGRKAWIKIPNKDPRNSSNERVVGLIMKIKVIKSKICNPLGECEVPMFFHKGFVKHEEIKQIRLEMMNAQKGGKLNAKERDNEEDED
jgi:recombination protein RecA